MSGGVDSSVAAALLKKQGYDVIGVFMKNWSQDFAAPKSGRRSTELSEPRSGAGASPSRTGRGDFGCTWVEDAEDARKVAKVLDISFYVWNFEKEYYEKVVEYFLREYAAGRTPNPDVMCNREIKFKLFLDKALSLGADYVATGHYARIKKLRITNYELKANPQSAIRNPKIYQLRKGIDPAKDQSYFLYTLKQEQLAKILFPIGEYKKSKVRQIAKKFGLPNYAKKDSQGICFIGKINVREFLKEKIPAVAGEIVATSGQVIGQHDGLPYYTIGQREGMGLGGDGPYYVVNKDFETNRLFVSNDQNDPQLWKKEFTITDVSWVGNVPEFSLEAGVSIRYHHLNYPAVISKQETENRLKIVFDQPQRAITPGQAAVIYQGDELLGGGVIDKVF